MATPTEIERVREYVAEPNEDGGWTGPRIAAYIDESGSDLYLAAAEIWGVKASAYAGMVDVSESGSSRRMSGLHQNAILREAYYRGRSENSRGGGAPFVVPIRRR